MAYVNFKELVWSKYIQHENEKFTVLEPLCNKQFQGEVKYGNTVKILGVARPTISDYVQATGLSDPETVQDSSVYLTIDKQKSFNFMVDDIDQAQSQPGLMEALMEESTRGLAEARDSHIAQIAGLNAGTASTSAVIDADTEWKAAIDAALTQLWTNGVKQSDMVFGVIPPWAYTYVENLLMDLKTQNDDLVKNGVIGYYKNIKMIMSNNLYNDGTDDYCLFGTNKAIGFASQINKTEPFRPEKFFSDAIRGLDTYGCKVVRPKELYTIKARKA